MRCRKYFRAAKQLFFAPVCAFLSYNNSNVPLSRQLERGTVGQPNQFIQRFYSLHFYVILPLSSGELCAMFGKAGHFVAIRLRLGAAQHMGSPGLQRCFAFICEVMALIHAPNI
jgi:hypothetical protein